MDGRNFNGEKTSLYGALVEKTNHFMGFIDLPFKYVRFQLNKSKSIDFWRLEIKICCNIFPDKMAASRKTRKSCDFILRILLLIGIEF